MVPLAPDYTVEVLVLGQSSRVGLYLGVEVPGTLG